MDSATTPDFVLPALTNLSDYVLTLVGKARKLYSKLAVNFGLMSLPDTGFMLVMVDVTADETVVSMWQPVPKGDNGPGMVDELKQGRNDALASALELLVQGVVPKNSHAVTPLVVPSEPSATEVEEPEYTCSECSGGIFPYNTGSAVVSAEDIVAFTTQRWGEQLCVACSNNRNRQRIRGN